MKRNDRCAARKSVFKTMSLFLCKGMHIKMSRQHFSTSYLSQQTRTFTDYSTRSDRNKSSHRLLFRYRHRECFSKGPAFRNATLSLSCSLAVSCVSASTLLVAIVTQHIFDQSLLRIGSAKWKTLKQVMFEKSLLLFTVLYSQNAPCPLKTLRLLE